MQIEFESRLAQYWPKAVSATLSAEQTEFYRTEIQNLLKTKNAVVLPQRLSKNM